MKKLYNYLLGGARIASITEEIMKQQSLIIITLSIFIFGCTHTHKINPRSSATILAELNQQLQGQEGTIFLTDMQEFVGSSIQVRNDSVFWVEPSQGEHKRISRSEVRKIILLKRGRGALEGLGIFALIGGVSGGLLTASYVCGRVEDCDTGGAFLDGAILGAVGAGVVFGLPIGAAIGSRDEYILIAPTDSTSNKY